MLIRTLILTLVLAGLTLGGCSSRKGKSVQFERTSALWMCQPDASREDWDCIQDTARARSVEEKNPPPR